MNGPDASAPRYRPVLLNSALKQRLGFVPTKTSAQAFDALIAARAVQGRPLTAFSRGG